MRLYGIDDNQEVKRLTGQAESRVPFALTKTLLIFVPSAIVLTLVLGRIIGETWAGVLGVFAAGLIAPTRLLCRRSARMHIRRVLSERNRCVSCGYDLSGNASGHCPECGEGVSRFDRPKCYYPER